MTSQTQASNVPRIALGRIVFALSAVLLGVAGSTAPAQAQTFSVIHNFTDGGDGGYPYAGVTVTSSGVLYGTASDGGDHDAGTVFKLSQINSTWVLRPLYAFTGGSDGAFPWGGAVIGPNGALYGTTLYGGGDNYGTVFELMPPATVCKSITCYWNETVLYAFAGAPDGRYPYFVNLTFDPAGNIYGTTNGGGTYGGGTAFKLTPSGAGYAESILHSFGNGVEGGTDGIGPDSGVVLDAAGNVYGTTTFGGTGDECASNCGTVYQLMPSGQGWVEDVLVNFNYFGNGANPAGNLIIDASGTLYGTTGNGGESDGDGGTFSLAFLGKQWIETAFHTFSNGLCAPQSGLAMDAAGNFFGTCAVGGAHNDGWIFELACSQDCGLVDLHDFTGSDGDQPSGTPTLDANGNLYGTTYYGGTGGNCDHGCGVVWEIAGVGAPRKN